MTKQTIAIAGTALLATLAGDTGRRHWPATLAGGIWVGRALATGAPTQAPLTYAGTRTNQDGKA